MKTVISCGSFCCVSETFPLSTMFIISLFLETEKQTEEEEEEEEETESVLLTGLAGQRCVNAAG